MPAIAVAIATPAQTIASITTMTASGFPHRAPKNSDVPSTTTEISKIPTRNMMTTFVMSTTDFGIGDARTRASVPSIRST